MDAAEYSDLKLGPACVCVRVCVCVYAPNLRFGRLWIIRWV